MSQAQGKGKLSYGFALETLLKSKGPNLSTFHGGGKGGGGGNAEGGGESGGGSVA